MVRGGGATSPQMVPGWYHLRALRRQFRAEVARLQARVDEVCREVCPPLPVAAQRSCTAAPCSSVARPTAPSPSPRADPPSRDASAARSSSSRGASPRPSSLACAGSPPPSSTSSQPPTAGPRDAPSSSPRSRSASPRATSTEEPRAELTEGPPRPDLLRLGLREAAERGVTVKVTRIQVCWRRSLARRMVGATRIQAWWRGLFARHPRLKANRRVAALAAVLFAPLQGLPDDPVKKRFGLTKAERRRAVLQAARSGRR